MIVKTTLKKKNFSPNIFQSSPFLVGEKEVAMGIDDEDFEDDFEDTEDETEAEDDFENDSDESDCESCSGTGYDALDGGQCEDCYGTGDAGEAD